MRVAMVGQKTHLSRFGGVERHVGLLADHLSARGHDVTVFARRGYVDAEPASAVRSTVRPCIPTKHLEAITHTSLCALEASLRGFDVIHFHAVGPSLAIPFARVRRGPAVCATIHDQDYNKAKWSGIARLALKAGEVTACRRADAVITVARYLQRHLENTYGRETSYIPNASDPLDLRPPSSMLRTFGLEPRRYLLFMARLVPEKGCDVLIKALRASKTPYAVAVVGGSSHSDEHERHLHELAARDERIHFLGFQSGAALDELRTNAAAFMMPSRQEGLPFALLEALWYGLPVIASDIPAVHEVEGAVPAHRVALVPPGDEEALRAAIEALPFPGAVATPGELNWPTWTDVAAQVEEVYQTAMDRHRGASSASAARSANTAASQ